MTVVLLPERVLARADLERLHRIWPEGRRNPPSASFDSFPVTGPGACLRIAVVRLAIAGREPSATFAVDAAGAGGDGRPGRAGRETMPRQQSKAQKKTVGRVMHEFKHGELKTARGKRKVKNPKQAIAIALREAGASKYKSKKKNEASLRRTKAKERRGQTARDAVEGRGGRRRTPGKGSRRTASGARHAGTAARGRAGAAEGKTRAELYEQAKRRKIPGRSRMSKAQLARALAR
jgi:hypothetical protein